MLKLQEGAGQPGRPVFRLQSLEWPSEQPSPHRGLVSTDDIDESDTRQLFLLMWEEYHRRRAASEARQSSAGRLLTGALQRLPAGQRERFAEEWAADLAEIHGRFARFRWQLGIRLTARRLARTAAAHSPAAARER
ncbi:MAG TPA: hypothetical protein VFU36_14605 [Jatrophihabitans sp.]|nr:hypothetical protein [Jatrophihabitans sp.]